MMRLLEKVGEEQVCIEEVERECYEELFFYVSEGGVELMTEETCHVL
jgi:hypothetical protein